MDTLDTFIYAQPTKVEPPVGSLIAVVPRGITNAEQLLQDLYEQLQLPEYFGFNWNALEECIRDFHWVKAQKVILIHEELPALIHTDLVIYIHILKDSIEYWRSSEDDRLIVVFPEACSEKIQLLANEKI